jgi:Asp-tRNA(Asn)/Glu-tRNA(Gln) amidotransferase A subunit family amidase
LKDLFFNKSITEIHDGYNNKTLDPVSTAQYCINQINKFEDKYSTWVYFDKEKHIKQAKDIKNRLEAGGKVRPLEGIPVGIKDIMNTVEFPTEMGSTLWKNFTPGNDARVVYYVRNAGGIIPGKTVTAEFAVHTLGKTLNPHDITRTPGTSSSGSAVAIALGMVPVALGSQTAGSIVRPASFCGVYGCKPSFGLIPRTGMLKTTDSLDTVGYFTTHFIDLERVFDVIRVHGFDYPISHAALNDPSRQDKSANRPWRVVLARTHTWKYAPLYAQEAIIDFAEKLSQVRDIEIIESDLPEEMNTSHEIHSAIYDKTLSYYFKEEFKKAELVSPIMNDLIRHGSEITVPQYQQALKDQEHLSHVMDKFLQNFDIIISLSTAGEAPLREEKETPDPALIWTMTHLPVISAPVLRSPKGLPFGVQIVARRYNDRLLFKFCRYLLSLGLIPEGPNPRL